jgi:hypothetical protein
MLIIMGIFPVNKKLITLAIVQLNKQKAGSVFINSKCNCSLKHMICLVFKNCSHFKLMFIY